MHAALVMNQPNLIQLKEVYFDLERLGRSPHQAVILILKWLWIMQTKDVSSAKPNASFNKTNILNFFCDVFVLTA